ncbi:hypothetical protein [Citrobacter sp. S-77]|uniref:hypothetical protein n=1 Tax=Citrobacter sp. S-77 TaxID=1080067 RepID=UPI0005EECAEC|nr:hypothetical protein [Citrobacter sp. S-77]
MTKLTKLLTKPRLFFSDALVKRTNSLIVNGHKAMKQENGNAQHLLAVNNGTVRVNLVIIDNIDNLNKNKSNVLKYQCRTLEKYTYFDRVSYISDSIKSSNANYAVYKSYNDFYEKVISRSSLRLEYFVFVGLNFFFLREAGFDYFVNEEMSGITYIKKQISKNNTLQDLFSSIYGSFEYKFNPVENYCCVNNLILNQYHQVLFKINDLDSYFFKFLPVVNAVNCYGRNCSETKIQFANLNGGHHEKLTWLQTVHGSGRCPLAITFNKMRKEVDDEYSTFLDSIVPHTSKLENEIIISIPKNKLNLE